MIIVILAVVVQYIDGNQKIVHVSELISDGFASGEDDNNLMCCVYGNCSCNSLDQALANLASNVLINITTDVTLSSLISISNLEYVSINGHNNPTVNCKIAGRIHFRFCDNCIVQGVTWDGCGIENIDNHSEPGWLKLSNSSNVTIQNCTFQYSKGQAVVLSEVSGEVNIKDCNFVYNSYYKDHGSVIHYTTDAASKCSQHLFTISNCYFTDNEGAKSLVYIENRISECNDDINVTFHGSNFWYNQGLSIYVVNQRLYFTGKFLFQYNTAKNGAGIYVIDHSTVIFGENSDVKFTQNSAKYKGGAALLRNHSSIIFDQNSTVNFNINSATSGTIYSDIGSNVVFKANCHVTFSHNSATQLCAAICSSNHSYIIFTGNSNVTFSNNTALNSVRIGLEYGDPFCPDIENYVGKNNAINGGSTIFSSSHSHISFEGTSTTIFKDNNAHFGGAILSYNHSHISFEGVSTAMFKDNKAYLVGGAICSFSHSHLSFKRFSNISFSDNTAFLGGAISSKDYSNISFEENSITLFNNNIATGNSLYYGGGGGAMLNCDHSYLVFKGNSSTSFSNNIADFIGGAIFSYRYGNMSFEENSTTLFRNNVAKSVAGGAMLNIYHSHLAFKGNSNTSFSDNTAHFYGGAIVSFEYSNIFFEENSTTLFNNNKGNLGGAILFNFNSVISFKGYCSVTFNNNKAIRSGGAVYYCATSILNNQDGFLLLLHSPYAFCRTTENFGYGSIVMVSFLEFANVIFKNNIASDNGGGLYCEHHLSLMFKGNTVVKFSDNKATNGGAVYFASNDNFRLIDVSFFEFTNVTFKGNEASQKGGAMYCGGRNYMIGGNSVVTFSDNKARQNGGVLYSMNSYVSFNGNSKVSVAYNEARLDGGVIYCGVNSTVSFLEFTKVSFNSNQADNGGVLFANDKSKVSFEGHALVTFVQNEAGIRGGAGYFSMHCIIKFKEDANVTFKNNNALFGGAICLNIISKITFKDNSTVSFKNNMVTNDGGAINVLTNSSIMVNDNTTITFAANKAQYGGALYFDATHTTLEFTDNERDFSFISGTARIAGDYMYFDSTGSSGSCLNNRVIDIKNETKNFVTTPPNKLEFFAPAACINNDNKTAECDTYYLKHIMLGEEITIPVCVLNYCNQPSYLIQFLLQGLKQNYS